MTTDQLKYMLDQAVDQFNRPQFIEHDPISIPHQFTKLQDREIMGFWTAMLSWGQRPVIMQNANRLVQLMDGAPSDFVLNHQEKDRERFLAFKHRTFQATDTLYFLEFFQQYYRQNTSLEQAFTRGLSHNALDISGALSAFHNQFFDHPFAPERTRKHISTPSRGSTCKRLNMFLRWMVRNDNNGVDFGIWKQISPRQLLIPLDVHVDRVARRLGLLERTRSDWQSVLELTAALRAFDPTDPVKYDFALFGMGVLEAKEL
jgi:uncharacterized protein (TIGR02757 family)